MAASAEANLPRDLAPLVCCCACAGGSVSETSLPPTPPWSPPVDLSFNLSSLAGWFVPLSHRRAARLGKGLEGAVDRRL